MLRNTRAHRPSRRKPRREATTIGGRPLKPSTLMMGHGYDPVLSEGALKPPIFLTTTFVFESAEAGQAPLRRHHRRGRQGGGAWSIRASTGPTRRSSRTASAIWDEAEDALVFSSGMSAICILLMASASPAT